MKKKNGNNRIWRILLALLLLALIVGGVLSRIQNGNREKAPAVISGGAPITEAESEEKNDGGIDLPGYASIIFKAGQTQQDFVIPNPPQNTCLVRMSLILEDGMTIWTSELVKPGCSCEPIELIAPMERGEYKNATLKYECFADDAAQTQLNGAQTSLTILAK